MSEFANCQHCKMTGTCDTGENGSSCRKCVAEWSQRYEKQFDPGTTYKGLVCSVCWGKGITEPSQRKWDYQFPAVLALTFVVLAFLLLFLGDRIGLATEQSLPFVSTLVGSITGFYFGARRGTIGPVKPVTPKK